MHPFFVPQLSRRWVALRLTRDTNHAELDKPQTALVNRPGDIAIMVLRCKARRFFDSHLISRRKPDERYPLNRVRVSEQEVVGARGFEPPTYGTQNR